MEKVKALAVIKKIALIIFTSLSFILAFLSIFISLVSFSKTPENTAEVFGFKIYIAQNDIENTKITKNSLVIIKDTDYDDFYTLDILNSKDTIVIKHIGGAVSFFSSSKLSAVIVPLAFLFFFIFLIEIKNIIINASKKPTE